MGREGGYRGMERESGRDRKKERKRERVSELHDQASFSLKPSVTSPAIVVATLSATSPVIVVVQPLCRNYHCRRGLGGQRC